MRILKTIFIAIVALILSTILVLSVKANVSSEDRKIYNNMRLDECPVCGYMVETYKNDEGYYIKCPECGYKSDYYNTAIDATNDWNKGDQNVELDTDE